jgi:multicomponent Na+:H+ antiporter subunit E
MRCRSDAAMLAFHCTAKFEAFMSDGAPTPTKSPAARLFLFFGLWLMIAGWTAKDLPIGLVTAGGAVWISLRLLPPGGAHPRIAPLCALVLRFLRGSIFAGFDVARRALAPRLDLKPGFVACPLTVPPGESRNAFCLYQSLQPGTLPTGAEGETLLVHALDISQPVAASLAADETLFKKAAGHG